MNLTPWGPKAIIMLVRRCFKEHLLYYPFFPGKKIIQKAITMADSELEPVSPDSHFSSIVLCYITFLT